MRETRDQTMDDSPELQLERLLAGEDLTPRQEGTWPTPGQFIAEWNNMPAEQRLALADQIITFYQGRKEHLVGRCRCQSWHERNELDIAEGHTSRGR